MTFSDSTQAPARTSSLSFLSLMIHLRTQHALLTSHRLITTWVVPTFWLWGIILCFCVRMGFQFSSGYTQEYSGYFRLWFWFSCFEEMIKYLLHHLTPTSKVQGSDLSTFLQRLHSVSPQLFFRPSEEEEAHHGGFDPHFPNDSW